MFRIRIPGLLFIALFFLHTSCTHQELDIKKILASVSDHFVPDSRTGIFDIDIMQEAGEYILSGETDNAIALEAVLDSLERLSIPYVNNVRVLPEEQLGDRFWGIINISVSNIRKDPRHSSELVTQGILGTPVKVMKKKGGWYLIQTPDHYLGWVDGGGIELKSQDEINVFFSSEKIIFTGIYGFSYMEPVEDATTISDLTSGNMLILDEINDFYYKISYPDGRMGYVKKSESEVFSEWTQEKPLNGSELTSTAFEFLGVPYLWGGTSAKAMDCSGFTKTIYFLHGLVLPRDASQQVNLGTLIDDKMAFNKLKDGDLLFFGKAATDSTQERVVHVGMWIGDMKFIHASGDVNVRSMDPESIIFDEYNLKRYLRTKRLMETKNIEELFIRKSYLNAW